MKAKRSWLYTAILIPYELIIFLALAKTFQRLGATKAYPGLIQAQWLIAVGLALGLLILFGCLWGRLEISRRINRFKRLPNYLEWLAGLLLLAAGMALRTVIVVRYPFTPDGEGLVSFEVGKLVSLGSITMVSPYYCDYVSLFPATMGYARLLSILFSFTEASVSAAKALNLILQGTTLFVLWRMARMLSGRGGGLVTLAAAAFWPSMILFGGEIAGEFETALLLFLALYFVVSQEYRPLNQTHTFRHAFRLFFAGVCLGAATGTWLLVPVTVLSLALHMCGQRRELPAKAPIDIPLGHRLVSKGWSSFLVLLLAFFAAFWFQRLTTGYVIDRTPAGPVASFGSAVMQGLNPGSEGAWNQDDTDFLMEKMEETGSATEAQLRCFDIARERLGMPAKSLVSLMMSKMNTLLGRDDFSAVLSLQHLSESGKMDIESASFFYRSVDWCNFYYMFFLLFAGIGGIMAYKRGQSFACALMLMLTGTVLAYLVLECQNRYHYILLPVLCLMSGIAVREILRDCSEWIMLRRLERLRAVQAEEKRKREIEAVEQQKIELNRLRAEALHAQFDMGKALEEGHIRIIASEAAVGAPKEEAPAARASSPEGSGASHA